MSKAHPRPQLLVFRRVAMVRIIDQTTCWAFQHFNHTQAAQAGEPAQPTSLLLLAPISGPNQVKFGNSDWHGNWHFDGNAVLNLSFNCKGSGYILKNTTLFMKDATLRFEGYDQCGSLIELKLQKRWKLVESGWVADEM